jgi:hypothetical protein
LHRSALKGFAEVMLLGSKSILARCQVRKDNASGTLQIPMAHGLSASNMIINNHRRCIRVLILRLHIFSVTHEHP